LTGAQGDTGATGATGPTGAQGDTGATGASGWAAAQDITAKTAHYTVASGDVGKLITFDTTTQTYLIIPAGLGSNGQIIDVAQLGAGKPELLPATGVQLRSLSGTRVKGQYGRARAQRIGTDEWQLYGDLETGFSPLDLSPVLWLDASDTSTITESGGSVSQWNNKGTLGNFTQGTGAVQPTTGASTISGRNVIDFAADYLTAANTNEWKFLHDGTVWVMAAAWQAGTTANPNAAYAFFGSSGGLTNAEGVYFTYDDRSALSRNDAVVAYTSRNVLNTFGVVSNTGNDFHVPNTPVVATALFDPANATAANRLLLQVNANTPVSNNASTLAPSTGDPTYSLQIGAGGNNAIPLTGKIAEIVVVSGADATAANRQLLRDYLNAKWGVY
jgi:hypothetical protein